MKISGISLLLPRISFFSICDFMTHRTHIGEKGFNCFPKQFVTGDIPITKINNINSSQIYVLMTQQFLWRLRANLFSLDLFFKNLFLTLVRSITASAIPLFIKGLLLAVRYFLFLGIDIKSPNANVYIQTDIRMGNHQINAELKYLAEFMF